MDTDGLELDQADVMVGGNSIRAIGAAGLQILSLVSRGTQRAFVSLEADTTDLLLADVDHLGKGYGVLAPDSSGLTRLTFRDSRFEHVGNGSPGDALQLNCATFGASFVDVIGCTAVGYIGEASSMGMGFGFAGVTDGRLIGCRVQQCGGRRLPSREWLRSLAVRRPDRPRHRRARPDRWQRLGADRLRQQRRQRRADARRRTAATTA